MIYQSGPGLVGPDFEDGVRNQIVLEAIAKAARTKRSVSVGSP